MLPTNVPNVIEILGFDPSHQAGGSILATQDPPLMIEELRLRFDPSHQAGGSTLATQDPPVMIEGLSLR